MKNLNAIVVATVLVAGCTGVATSSLSGNKSLVLTPKVIDSVYQTQTAQSLYTSANINHLWVELKDGTVVASKDIPNANLNQAVVFNNLKNGKTYTVQAKAYLSAGTGTKISVDGSSVMTITVGTDDRPTVNPIPVKLMDTPFNGYGTNSIAVTPGSYTYAASESIATASP